MSLRAKLIEAGAEALDGMPAALLGAAAGAVLDAFLDVLAENADEWSFVVWPGTTTSTEVRSVHRLLAVLRESDV